MEDAHRAGLSGKGPWKSYPAAMLRARAISAMARAMFPDALSGVVYTPEELGAEVDDDGHVVSAPGDSENQRPPISGRDVGPKPDVISPKPEVISQMISPAPAPKPPPPADPHSDPLDWVVNFGTREKGYFDISLREAILRDGLPKVQKYIQGLIDSWDTKNKKENTTKPYPHSYIMMNNRILQYQDQLRDGRPPIEEEERTPTRETYDFPPPSWNDDFDDGGQR
jgi:hypothetical protein